MIMQIYAQFLQRWNVETQGYLSVSNTTCLSTFSFTLSSVITQFRVKWYITIVQDNSTSSKLVPIESIHVMSCKQSHKSYHHYILSKTLWQEVQKSHPSQSQQYWVCGPSHGQNHLFTFLNTVPAHNRWTCRTQLAHVMHGYAMMWRSSEMISTTYFFINTTPKNLTDKNPQSTDYLILSWLV